MDAPLARATYYSPVALDSLPTGHPAEASLAEPRPLGLAAAIAVVTGESIALGIFLTPAAMAKSLGSPLLLGVVWLGMALMAMCGALCYSELAIRYPQSGGEYVYLRAGYGDQVAFLYGWMSSVVMYPGVAAALAMGAAPYFAEVLPVGARALAWIPAVLLCLFCAINLLGTRLSGAILSGVNLLKLGVLAALVVWAVVSGHAHAANLFPLTVRRPGSDAIFPAIAGAAVSAFFSFGGWWEAGKIAGEVRNPKKTLPLAFLGGVADQRHISRRPADRETQFEYRLCRAIRSSPLWDGRSPRAFDLRADMRLRRHGRAHHGRTARLLCHGPVRRVFPRVWKAASALGHAGQCNPAPNGPFARGAVVGSLRSRSRLHHFFRGALSGYYGFHALPGDSASARLVVSRRSPRVSGDERLDRAAHSHARPVTGAGRHRHCALRYSAASLLCQ